MTTPRILPSIDRLRQRPAVRALETEYGPAAVLAALRGVTDMLRRELTAAGLPASPIGDSEQAASTIEQRTASQLAVGFEPSLVPVINATGVIVHTNLGRAPLASPAVERVASLAAGYTNLEYDLDDGRWSARDVLAETLLGRLTGAVGAVVVNNTAAAVLIM
ncbi:MAG: hypothetical protein QF681_06400, partial [Vicinamibacterales bacterium]|nr:hypothetical protein [Vicinamibacterales bacterium]